MPTPDVPAGASAAPRTGDAPGALRAIGSIGGVGGLRPTQAGHNTGSNGGGLNTQDLRRTAQGEDDRAVVAQVTKGLMAALKNGDEKGGEVVLRLQPRVLGELKIKVAMDGQTIGAEFHVSTKQARDLLHQSLTNLRAELESRGLMVHRLDVQLSAPPERTLDHPAPGGAHHAVGQESYSGQGQSGQQRQSADPGSDRGANRGTGSWNAGAHESSAGTSGAPTEGVGSDSEWQVDMMA